MKILTIILSSLILLGCSVVTPDPIKDGAYSYDSSTPRQYDAYNSGFIRYTRNSRGEVKGAIITPNARDKYNTLIGKYRVQFKKEYGVDLQPGYGVWDFMDMYWNQLYHIEAQYLEYFITLNRWQKELRDPDDLWSKAKEGLGL